MAARKSDWLVSIVVAAALSASTLASGAHPRPPRGVDPGPNREAEGRLSELFLDISTINLLNGLRMSREQTEAVVALAREADRRRNHGDEAEPYRVTLRRALEAYEAFKAQANEGEPPGERLSRNAVYYENRILALKAQRARQVDRHQADFDARLRKVLSEGQLQIVETFEPCLVPPRDLKDPVRAGQVESDRGVKMLEHLRRLPKQVWDARKQQIAEGHLRRAVEGNRVEITSDKARAAAAQAFIDVVGKARAMADVEFEVEKGALAGQLSPKHSRAQIFERARVVRPKGQPREISRAARWLLHPRIIPILEHRLKSGKPFESAPGASTADAAS